MRIGDSSKCVGKALTMTWAYSSEHRIIVHPNFSIAFTSALKYMYIWTCSHSLPLCIYMCIYIYRIWLYVCTHVYMCVYICVHIHVSVQLSQPGLWWVGECYRQRVSECACVRCLGTAKWEKETGTSSPTVSPIVSPTVSPFFSVHLTVSPTFTFQDKTIEMASTHFVSFLLVATFRWQVYSGMFFAPLVFFPPL